MLDLLGPRVPDRLESTSLGGLSASSASQMMQAFRFLGLVKSDGETSPELRLMVEHPDSRVAVLSKVLRQSCPELFGPSATLLSGRAIEEFVSRSGLRPATQRKAVTFLLNAAAYLHLPVDMNSSAASASGSSASNPSEPLPTTPVSTKRSMSIELASGGTVEFSVDFDPLRLDKNDRDFVFELIDRLQEYRTNRRREEQEEQAGDDREVPF